MWKGTPRAQVVGQHVLGEAGLLLVEVDGDDEKATGARSRRTAACRAARGCPCRRTGTPSPCRRLDHVEVGDRLADLAVQLLAQLVGLEGLLRRGSRGWLSMRSARVR
jgi:hypothetical protein